MARKVCDYFEKYRIKQTEGLEEKQKHLCLNYRYNIEICDILDDEDEIIFLEK